LKILLFGIKVNVEVAFRLLHFADFGLKYSMLMGNPKSNITGRSPQEIGWRGEEREGRSQRSTTYYEAQRYFIRKGRTIANVSF
jgi:hypothetical protein